MYGNDNYDLLWSGVSGQHEEAQRKTAFVHSKVAVSQYWPFLARADSEADFENRLSLILSSVEAMVVPGTLDQVLASLRDDYRAVTGAFGKDDDDDSDDDDSDDDDKSDKKDNPFAKKDDSDSDDDEDDDKESDSDEDDDSDDDSDDEGGNPFGKSKDSDDKDSDKDSGKKPAVSPADQGKPKMKDWIKDKIGDKKESRRTDPGLGCPHCKWAGYTESERTAHIKSDHPGEYQGPTADMQYAKDRAKQATNYQPDPDAGWRYHPGYEQLQAPVNNGALQDGDGFVQDLAQGEGRSNPLIEQNQLTPGTWTQHDGMPERPMPQGTQRGYMPVNASFDKEGYLVVEANKYIKQEGGKWVIIQKGTGKVLSHHDSKEQAEESFSAMEMHKHESLTFDAQGFVVQAKPQHLLPNPPWGESYNDYSESHNSEGHPICSFCEGQTPATHRGTLLLDDGGKKYPHTTFYCDRHHLQYGRNVEDETPGLVTPGQHRLHGNLVDPAPGQPQQHNQFYFQQGTGVGQNEGFPQDPSNEPLPNYLEEFYGEVPPVSSSGSNEGTVDGQGYSKQSSLRYDALGYLVESPNFKLAYNSWEDEAPIREHEWESDPDYIVNRGYTHGRRGDLPEHPHEETYMVGYDAGRKHVRRKLAREDYGSNTERDAGKYDEEHFGYEPEEPDKSDLAHEKVPTGKGWDDPWANYKHAYHDDYAPRHQQHYFNGYMTGQKGSLPYPPKAPGHPAHDAYMEGWHAAFKDADTFSKARRVGSISTTDGKIIGLCPGCNRAIRKHDTIHGDEIHHLHNDSIRCHSSVEKSAGPEMLAELAGGEEAGAGSSGGMKTPGIPGMPSSGLPKQKEPDDWAWRSEAKVAADYLGRPDATNPTGRGADEYGARTWDAFQTTKPMQSPLDRNVNTPVLPAGPIHTRNINSPNPGSTLRNDKLDEARGRDDDDDED